MDLESLSTAQTVLVYVGIPLAIIGVIWFIWALPSWKRQGAHRPGDAWLAAPEWVEGPASVEGSHLAALEASGPSTQSDQASDEASQEPAGGGTSARW